MPDARVILCLNSGSSSRKLALFRFGPGGEELLAEGAAEEIGSRAGRLWIRDGHGKMLTDSARDFSGSAEPLLTLFDEIDRLRLPRPDAAGHRLVHGGANHVEPEPITPALMEELRRLIPFAPLHLPGELDGIEKTAGRYCGLHQVACFDTAFHRRMPEVAERFALPRSLWNDGIRRFGFHGISYEYILQTLGAALPSRVIIAHLGNGASMAAVLDGRPLDTSMGFTPTGGFMMGTRSGDLDPWVLLYLLKEKRCDADALERLVNHQAGLLGVSEAGSDVKMLLEKRGTDPKAAQAIEMFCYQARKYIGGFAAVLSGLDLLIFTAGIGERAAAIRWEICRGLEYMGIKLDRRSNDEDHPNVISMPDSRCAVRVIPTNEDLMIARHTHRLVFGAVCKA
jgi:acetate kinase